MALRRELGFLQVFCIASGAMISSGIFVLPGIAHAQAGPSVILSYAIAGILAASGMLNAAELATAMPKAGGDYFFITRALGPAVGSVSGLINWFSLSLKSAFALVGMAAFLRLFVDVEPWLTGLLLAALFTGLNLTGARHAGRLQVLLVIALLVLMSLFVILGLPHVRQENLTPFMPFGLNRTIATAGFVFVAYGGLIKISGVAEEIRNPARTIPRAMISALVAVLVIYTLMVLVTTGVLPSATLDGSLTPITDAAGVFMGPWGVRLLGLAAVLAFVSTANAGILAASRYLFALGRDELLPARFAGLSRRAGIPAFAVVLTGAFVASSLFLDLEVLVEGASLVLILGYILSSICVIVLRESGVQNYRPAFRAPLYPWLQVFSIVGFSLLFFEFGLGAWAICAGLFALGLTGYRLWGCRRARKDYALLHLVERLTSRELVTGGLERELRDIVRARDYMLPDRFDELVERSVILDLPGRLTAAEFFDLVSGEMAPALGVEPGWLSRRLSERETETSTAISPFLAIPHVVVEGSGRFELALVRAKAGISFSEEAPSVRAVFVLAGSLDERNFHLRALAAVAQLVQEPGFEQRWLCAKSPEAMREIVLLGRRYREGAGRTAP